ncbi:hypothetical protein WMQ15_18445, partial [Escherichia coli]
GSFVVIHSGGVDIAGPKINLNGGGSPGEAILPIPLIESGAYNLQFHFTDDDDVPYSNSKYIAYFADGSSKEGVTDNEGKTENFTGDEAKEISIHVVTG